MNEQLFGPMMRHPGTYDYQEHMHGAGTSSVEWAILGLAIAILVGVLLLLADRCRHRWHHHHGWGHPGGFDKPLEIVRWRYSRGELSREEYQQALADLGASPEQKSASPVNPPEEGDPPRRRRGK